MADTSGMTGQGPPAIPDATRAGRNPGAFWCIRHGFIGIRWSRWARNIISIRATPRQIALGVALGSFIAFTPLVGIQMLLAALVAAVLGASRKAAMLAVWISNPMTMAPIFALTYQLGILLGTSSTASASLTSSPDQMETTAYSVPTSGMTFEQVIQAGGDVVWPMFLGGAVVGLIAALIAYDLTHRAVLVYQAVPGKGR